MVRPLFQIELSLRYGVMGIYKDREMKILRIYPLPFIRITFDRSPQ